MISEIKLMQYADGTLSPEEKRKIDKEIKNNPKYLKTIKDFKKTRKFLLDVNEAIRAKPLSNTLKLKLKKIKQIEKRKALYDRTRKNNFYLTLYFALSNIFSYVITKVIIIIASLSGLFWILLKLTQKGVLVKLFIDIWPLILRYWVIFIESILSFFRKSIEFIDDLIPLGKQVAEIFNDLTPLLT